MTEENHILAYGLFPCEYKIICNFKELHWLRVNLEIETGKRNWKKKLTKRKKGGAKQAFESLFFYLDYFGVVQVLGIRCILRLWMNRVLVSIRGEVWVRKTSYNTKTIYWSVCIKPRRVKGHVVMLRVM